MRAEALRLGRRALLLSAAAGTACAQCPAPAAVVALRAVDGFPVVAATVNGTPASFLLDTGAQGHLLLPEAVAALGLSALPGTVPVFGTGGARDAPLVLLDGVQLGAVRLDPAPAPVAPLPGLPRTVPPIAGLLGAPLLDRYDLELDGPSGRLLLHPAGACAAPAGALPLLVTGDRQLLLEVAIDGTPVLALLDSGARATLLAAGAAARLGLGAPASANTARGVDGAALPVGHLRVARFAVGDDLRHDVPVSVAPLQLGAAGLLLGFDYLGARVVWISAVTGRVAFAPPAATAAPLPSRR